MAQIEEKQYGQALLAKGIGKERIKKYGFALEGKRVRIGDYHESEDIYYDA